MLALILLKGVKKKQNKKCGSKKKKILPRLMKKHRLKVMDCANDKSK